MENNFSNIIAPSDGVRRFLCKTSVLMAGLFSAVYCFCAFRMTFIEAHALGATLRTNMLYAAYVMLPLGFVTAAIFARVRKMGLAFSMISLLVSAAASLMLLLNSLASLLREQRLLGVSGSLLEFLTFGAFFALFVNLVMSCMDFRLRPVIGSVGATLAALALIVTSVRTILSFSALAFAWGTEFDWGNLRETVDTVRLRYHASWVFRSVLRGKPDSLHAMFVWRFYERIAACAFYAVMTTVFMKYKKETTFFNKLLAHASEYVAIPTARLPVTVFGGSAQNDSDKPSGEPDVPRRSGGSVRGRLAELSSMTRAKELGMDITGMADEYDAQRAADYDGYDPEYDDFGDPDVDEEELTEAERYIREKRRMRRSAGDSGADRRNRREHTDVFGDSDDAAPDDAAPGADRRRRVKKPVHVDGVNGADRRRREKTPAREMTDQEKYLLEERRKRQRLRESGSRNVPDRAPRRDQRGRSADVVRRRGQN